MKKSKGKHKLEGQDNATATVESAARGKQEYRVMTVALIRDPKETEEVEVAFSESARFYKLPRVNPEFERILTALREAKEKMRPVRVMMETPQSNVIADVMP